MSVIRFHPEADFEMMEAAVMYETLQHDLGKRFLSEVQNALTHIQINSKRHLGDDCGDEDSFFFVFLVCFVGKMKLTLSASAPPAELV